MRVADASTSAAASGRPGSVPLRAELESIVDRLHDPSQQRAALIEVLLRQRRIVGAMWFDLTVDPPATLVRRLPGPALENASLDEWLTGAAGELKTGRGLVESACPEVRNLSALSIAIQAVDHREGVVLLATRTADQLLREEWLALQQLAMVCEGASLRRLAAASDERTRLAAMLLDLCGRVTQGDSVRGGCQELVGSLQEQLDASLVAVGLSPANQTTPKVVALSDGVDADPHGIQVQRIEATLAESALADEVVCFPSVESSPSSPALAHKRLAAVMGAEAAISTPLHDAEGRVIGGLLCVGGAARLLVPTTRQMLHTATVPIGGAVAAVQRHAGGRLLRWGRALTGGAARVRGLLMMLAAAALAGVMMIPTPYRIAAGCRAEPTLRRLSPAPFDGLLQSTHVAPGDVVTAGELLATMDSREVEWELAGVVADREREAKERDTHLSAHEVARSMMAALEVERLSARESLLRDRLARLEIRSPIDGIVLSGSLDRRENVPVTVGQSLYEIAPLASLRLEVEIPADEVSHVRTGLPVEIRMHGQASEPVIGTIERIRPASEVREGRNVFVAEVAVDNLDGRLRPGMKGSVRITGDSHPLGWNLFHRPWEYLQTRLF